MITEVISSCAQFPPRGIALKTQFWSCYPILRAAGPRHGANVPVINKEDAMVKTRTRHRVPLSSQSLIFFLGAHSTQSAHSKRR
jgi:hypothetical protein